MAARYYDAVKWIALNDEPEVMDYAAVESQISVQLTADLFGKAVDRVATDVIRCRSYNDGSHADIPKQFHL
jgi:hypothetical protein